MLNGVRSRRAPPPRWLQTANASTTSLIDPNEYPKGLRVIYFVKTLLKGGGLTDKSNEVRSHALQRSAGRDHRSHKRQICGDRHHLARGARHRRLLANDSDSDSPLEGGRIVVLTLPTHGALTNPLNGVNTTGGFTYTATQTTPQYYGTDSFTYKLVSGRWTID